MSLIKLDSVGCVIDEKGVIYPMLVDGGYDEDGGRHVNDIENEEFFKALNRDELFIVEEHYRSSDGTYKELTPKESK